MKEILDPSYHSEGLPLVPDLIGADHILFGSDYPTPVFEIYPEKEEVRSDFKAMLKGDLKRVAVPQDNPIDVNYRELNHAFPDHPMFTNFDRYLW